MRKPIRWAACAMAIAVAACATGGATVPGSPQDAPGVPPGQGQPDARSHPMPDAPPAPDAPPVPHDASSVGPDAAVMPDAAGSGSGGQVCSVNGDCPDAGTCCWVLVCVPGQGLGSNLCFPS